ncbi:MAG TPA: aminoacyl-tRNA hydrolase [Patescibacteria group bacterium]
MKLIVGLGNPGEKYARTRHNLGFMVLDHMAELFGASFCDQSKFKAATAEIHSGGEKVILVKPLTFMNLSGDAVMALANFYKLETGDIWVIADDLDLPLGKVRVRNGGESGGHNGLKDIMAKLGTGDFWRIRVGIRGEEVRELNHQNNITTQDYVLARFADNESKMLYSTLESVAVLLKESIERNHLVAHTYQANGFDEHIGT